MGLDMFSLENRVAIITGSGRSIGKAIAIGMAEAGADIVTVARTSSEIEQTAAEIRQRGRKALAIPTDVRDKEQVDAAVRKTVEEFGKIDILLNNAGGMSPAKFLEMDEKTWDDILQENLKGIFLFDQAVAKVMIEKKCKGSIINMSAIGAFRAYTTSPAYVAAKAAIINFTQTLAADLAPYHIRVNAIAPGTIITSISSRWFEDNPEIKESRIKDIPLGRLGLPEDIVGGSIYLASDASNFVTGTTLIISGGQS